MPTAFLNDPDQEETNHSAPEADKPFAPAEAVETDVEPYEPPQLVKYERLESLIVSGE